MKRRVAHLADSHLEPKRLDEAVRVLDVALDQIIEFNPDLIVHAGDLHDRKSDIAVRQAGITILDQLADLAPLVLVRGNHDPIGDLSIYAGRRSRFPIYVVERAQVVRVAIAGGSSIDCQCLPWIDKAQMASQFEADSGTPHNTSFAANAAAATLLETWAAQVRPGTPTIGVGHLVVGGSVTSSGQQLIGQGIEFSAGDLERTGASAWMLGHIHAHQAFGSNRQIAYAGSTHRLNFGEPEDKGWLAWEIDTESGLAHSTFRQLPAQRIERWEWSLDEVRELLAGNIDFLSEGDRIRIRFQLRPEELATVDLEAVRQAVLARGAAEAKVEPILVHDTRTRVDREIESTHLEDQIATWLHQRGDESKETLDALTERLREIQVGDTPTCS